MKRELGRVLRMRKSSLGAFSVLAAVASAHTQCTPQWLWRILSKPRSFVNFLEKAAACTEYTPKPMPMERALGMAKAAGACTEYAPKLLERALSMPQSRWCEY